MRKLTFVLGGRLGQESFERKKLVWGNEDSIINLEGSCNHAVLKLHSEVLR